MVQTGNNKYEISVYNDELTTNGIIEQVKRIKKAFPELPVQFYDTLTDRLKDNNFTDKRLNDSVSKVIDNFKYPKPSISDFIRFDKTIKLHNYNYMCELCQKWGSKTWERYDKIRINGIVYWYDKSELADNG